MQRDSFMCSPETERSQRMLQISTSHLADELSLCLVRGSEREGAGWRSQQMLGRLILSHMGLNTFRTQRDPTNKQHLV